MTKIFDAYFVETNFGYVKRGTKLTASLQGELSITPFVEEADVFYDRPFAYAVSERARTYPRITSSRVVPVKVTYVTYETEEE